MASLNKDVRMTVKFYNVNPGFGKLKNEEFNDVFVHKSYIEDCGGQYSSEGNKILIPNQQVLCDLIPNPKKPNLMMAINVRLCQQDATRQAIGQQLIEMDLRGDIVDFYPDRQCGVINNRHYGRVDFQARDFDGPVHRLQENATVAFDLVRRQDVKMATNIKVLGGRTVSDGPAAIEAGILGEVTRLKETFGFIKTGGRDAFFHLSEVKNGYTVRVGQIVRFDLTPGSKGPNSFAAINISVVSGAAGRGPEPRRPGSRSGSAVSRGRKKMPQNNPARFPNNPPDKTRTGLGVKSDSEDWRAGDRNSRDLSAAFDLGVKLDIEPDFRAGERNNDQPEREAETSATDKVNQLLEDQRRAVARHSLERKTNNIPTERPSRDTERAEGVHTPTHRTPFRRQNDLSPPVLQLRPLPNPSTRPGSPPRHNPLSSTPTIASRLPMNAASVQPVRIPRVMDSRMHPFHPLPRREESDDSDGSNDSDEKHVPMAQHYLPRTPAQQQRTLPPYASLGDSTRPGETRECPRCSKILVWPLKSRCGHVFCRGCWEMWLKFMTTCPLSSCQKLVELEELEPEPF